MRFQFFFYSVVIKLGIVVQIREIRIFLNLVRVRTFFLDYDNVDYFFRLKEILVFVGKFSIGFFQQTGRFVFDFVFFVIFFQINRRFMLEFVRQLDKFKVVKVCKIVGCDFFGSSE